MVLFFLKISVENKKIKNLIKDVPSPRNCLMLKDNLVTQPDSSRPFAMDTCALLVKSSLFLICLGGFVAHVWEECGKFFENRKTVSVSFEADTYPRSGLLQTISFP
jgi:hypothetical protein